MCFKLDVCKIKPIIQNGTRLDRTLKCVNFLVFQTSQLYIVQHIKSCNVMDYNVSFQIFCNFVYVTIIMLNRWAVAQQYIILVGRLVLLFPLYSSG